MAGLGIIAGAGATGLLAGGITGAIRNASTDTPDWTATKVSAGATVGLATAFAGIVAARNVPSLERALPLVGLATIAICGAVGAAGFAASSLGANLLDG